MSPHLWQSRIFFTWEFVLACHGAIQNKEGYYAARFFLGMMEAGMFPGIMAQLNSWYRSEDMGKAIMRFFAIQNAAGVVGSLLCYGISYMNGVHGLSAWRWYVPLEILQALC
jgi:MFS family permease